MRKTLLDRCAVYEKECITNSATGTFNGERVENLASAVTSLVWLTVKIVSTFLCKHFNTSQSDLGFSKILN